MSDVSVIGAGAMGNALIEGLAASGADVSAWNRTRAKVEALSGPHVHVVGSAAEALAASPLTIISVSNHEVARALVKEAEADLEGKVLASTSFVDPSQAEDFNDVVGAAGGQYLDLAITATPREVRAGTGLFIVSGDRAAYEAQRARFGTLGMSTYVGETPGAAYVGGMPVALAYLPMAVALVQGVRICEYHGIPLDWFRSTVLEVYPVQIESLFERFLKGLEPSAAEVDGSVDIMADWAAEYAAYLRDMGLDPGVYEALHAMFSAASDAGDGGAHWTRVVGPATTS